MIRIRSAPQVFFMQIFRCKRSAFRNSRGCSSASAYILRVSAHLQRRLRHNDPLSREIRKRMVHRDGSVLRPGEQKACHLRGVFPSRIRLPDGRCDHHQLARRGPPVPGSEGERAAGRGPPSGSWGELQPDLRPFVLREHADDTVDAVHRGIRMDR